MLIARSDKWGNGQKLIGFPMGLGLFFSLLMVLISLLCVLSSKNERKYQLLGLRFGGSCSEKRVLKDTSHALYIAIKRKGDNW
jgi:hypothetical protein